MTIIKSIPLIGAAGAGGAVSDGTFFSDLQTLGLTTNLQFCLDAGDSASYTSGQSWLDRSGNGQDFFLGATSAAEGSDPTFNGVAGNKSSNEYFSFDGGDFFRYDSANEVWMNSLHKDNAIYTILTWIYFGSFTGAGGVFGTISTSGGPGILMEIFGSSGKISLWVDTAAEANVMGPMNSDAATSTGAWHLIGCSVNEATGAGGGFLYEDGAYKQVAVADTFSSTYTSPATGASNFTLELGAKGNGLAAMRSGGRMAGFFAWSGTALTKAQIDTIWNQQKTRFGL